MTFWNIFMVFSFYFLYLQFWLVAWLSSFPWHPFVDYFGWPLFWHMQGPAHESFWIFVRQVRWRVIFEYSFHPILICFQSSCHQKQMAFPHFSKWVFCRIGTEVSKLLLDLETCEVMVFEEQSFWIWFQHPHFERPGFFCEVKHLVWPHHHRQRSCFGQVWDPFSA